MQPEHLEQLRRQAAELARLTRELAAAVPPQVEGSDGTGWVHLVLGRDGTPTEIRVRDGWRQRLEPEQLAGAVLDANTDALQQAMRAWVTAADETGWRPHRTDIGANAPEEHVQTGHRTPEGPFGHVRDSNDLAEEVLRRLRDAQTAPAAEPASVAGRDDGKHVTIELAAGGLAACAIEPHWARQHDGVSISAALSTALRQAVARRPAAPSAGGEAGGEPDTLIGDALATLTSLTATPPDQGGNG